MYHSSLGETNGADSLKGGKGRVILLPEAMLVNSSKANGAGAVLPFYGNRDVGVEADFSLFPYAIVLLLV